MYTGTVSIYIHRHICILFFCFTPVLPPLLIYIRLDSCFTRTLLVRFVLCVCVCVCRLTGLVECVQQSEGLRRDRAWG
jgi:hypothetical protein